MDVGGNDVRTSARRDGSVLLLSGGLDSTALAALERPTLCLVIDYGQRPAPAEVRAATAVTDALDLPIEHLRLDLGDTGGGLLRDDRPLPGGPSPEWWPFRNQILVTAAAAVALRNNLHTVMVGTVIDDRDRHADGSPAFYAALDRLFALQEGDVRVVTPAIDETSTALVGRSGLGEDVLAWTVSCHRASLPCGQCPGCWKRAKVLERLGLLQTPGP
ncbi:7-cyano-7-deazaguanine synthase QueC [Dactylosporangium roseum]